MSQKKSKCIITGCQGTAKIHRFPKDDPDLMKVWIQKVGHPRLGTLPIEQVWNNFKVCNIHFEPHFKVPGTRRGLMKGAYPTLFLPSSTKEKKVVASDTTKDVTDKLTKVIFNKDTSFESSQLSQCSNQESIKNMEEQSLPKPPQSNIKPIGPKEAEDILNNAMMDHDYFSNHKDDETILIPVCRFCLRTIQSVHIKKLYNIDSNDNSTKAEQIIEMMSDFLGTKVNLNISADPVMCMECLFLLRCGYKFKQSVLEVEAKLLKSFLNVNCFIDLNSHSQGKIDSDISEKDTYYSSISKKTSLEHFQRIDKDMIEDKENDDDYFGDKADSFSQQNVGIESDLSPYYTCPYLCHICGLYFDKQRQITIHKNFHLRQKLQEDLPILQTFLKPLIVKPKKEKLLCTTNNCKCNKEFLCEHCGFTTLYCKTFSNHKTKHLFYPYHCPLCKRKWRTISGLKFHMHLHATSNIFTKLCHLCGRNIRADNFSKHVKSHLPKAIQMLPCDKCNFRASSQKHLAIHVERIHGTNHKLYCNICLKGFQRQKLLEKHLAIHNMKTSKKVYIYVCDCNIVFKNLVKYNAHLRDIHGAHSYNCHFCDKKFMARPSLYRHNKKCHKNVG